MRVGRGTRASGDDRKAERERKEENTGLYIHRSHSGLLGTRKLEKEGVGGGGRFHTIQHLIAVLSLPEWLCSKVGEPLDCFIICQGEVTRQRP